MGQLLPTSQAAGHVLKIVTVKTLFKRGDGFLNNSPTSLRHMINIEAKRRKGRKSDGVDKLPALTTPNGLVEKWRGGSCPLLLAGEASKRRRENATYTATCVDHCLFDWMRTEFRPGPLALRTVVSSARMMNVLPFA